MHAKNLTCPDEGREACRTNNELRPQLMEWNVNTNGSCPYSRQSALNAAYKKYLDDV